jgi:hypothetical protein
LLVVDIFFSFFSCRFMSLSLFLLPVVLCYLPSCQSFTLRQGLPVYVFVSSCYVFVSLALAGCALLPPFLPVVHAAAGPAAVALSFLILLDVLCYLPVLCCDAESTFQLLWSLLTGYKASKGEVLETGTT